MFGIGKIFNIIKAVMPFLQFIPALAPFAALFNIADTVANLVKNFKNGFSFLDLVAKFAPLPKGFGQAANILGDCFGLSSSKMNLFQSSFSSSSNIFKALDEVKNVVDNLTHLNNVRSSNAYNQYV